MTTYKVTQLSPTEFTLTSPTGRNLSDVVICSSAADAERLAGGMCERRLLAVVS